MEGDTKYALISVFDKTNIIELATALLNAGYQLLSTGGTAQQLQQQHLPVTAISQYTNFPEILNGRVKTLHPKIHAGILAKGQQDQATLQQLHIPMIHMVIANLYPFEDVTLDTNCTFETAIENIDIGGPTLIRAAAKNYQRVIVVTNPFDYPDIIDKLNKNIEFSEQDRFSYARRAFQRIATYDFAISNYFEQQLSSALPSDNLLEWKKHLSYHLLKSDIKPLRYGENPQQQAGFISFLNATTPLHNTIQLQGKMLSYNNLADAETALNLVNSFEKPACVIVKHTNPCGVALGKSCIEAYQKAYQTDPISAFGGIIAFNHPLDHKTALTILEQQFCEIIMAPDFNQDAITLFSEKQNLRVLKTKVNPNTPEKMITYDIKTLSNGLLFQEKDLNNETTFKCVTQIKPSSTIMEEIKFSWQIAKFVKSNAIVITHHSQALGIGAGQMSRIFSVEVAIEKALKAGFDLKGACLASDAFFPFSDSIELAAKHGIQFIIQPEGGIKLKEVIAAADKNHIGMLLANHRHFRH